MDINEEALELLRENNDMLRQIIAYINYVIAHADTENRNDFLMNLAANMLGTGIENRLFTSNK